MIKNKTQRIIENIFDIVQNTDFTLKQYKKDTKDMNVELDCEANTINYYDINDQLLFEIKINN
jgi:hypothetical protein